MYSKFRTLCFRAAPCALLAVMMATVPALAALPTTTNDFAFAGTQPGALVDEIRPSNNCILCHGYYNAGEIEVTPNWQGSMMAQSARDPVWYAALTIANQDAPGAGQACIRCHSPKAFLEGRADPPDTSAFIDEDRDGITCNACHRMVDPVYTPGQSPAEDQDILDGLVSVPASPGSAAYVMDPENRVRGPFVIPGVFDVMVTQSGAANDVLVGPFHQNSAFCGTCHDVSNPVYDKQMDGSFAPTSFDAPHPTGQQNAMFPEQRTYSEWLHSAYPAGVDADGRFGGNIPDGVVRSCQDCHMPRRDGKACIQDEEEFPPRPDMPIHDFLGVNTWVRGAIPDVFPQDIVGQGGTINPANLIAGQNKALVFLQLAATLDAEQTDAVLDVQVTNESGHKLPTGYPEGRRMWLNVKFLNAADEVVAESGAYNDATADLVTSGTKIYEVRMGLDATAATAAGRPAGESFHLVLNNAMVRDNRIPPRGFTNSAYESFNGAPVAYNYADGQYWDDTRYALPGGAVRAEARLYYQTSTKPYMEFLRDENVTNGWGQTVYDLWIDHGRSAPALMAQATVELGAYAVGDGDGDGDADLSDYLGFQQCLTGPGGAVATPACKAFDFDWDDDVDMVDFALFAGVLP